MAAKNLGAVTMEKSIMNSYLKSSLIALISVFFTSVGLAECPNLKGTYMCGLGQREVSIDQFINEDGLPILGLLSAEYIADGKHHTRLVKREEKGEETQVVKEELIDIYINYVVSCDEKTINLSISKPIKIVLSFRKIEGGLELSSKSRVTLEMKSILEQKHEIVSAIMNKPQNEKTRKKLGQTIKTIKALDNKLIKMAALITKDDELIDISQDQYNCVKNGDD